MRKGDIQKVPDRMSPTGSDYIIIRIGLLKHQPHGFDVVTRKSPVPPGIEVPEKELLLKTELDARNPFGDLPRHECFAATRGFVIEEDAIDGELVVRFTVIPCDPVSVHFRGSI